MQMFALGATREQHRHNFWQLVFLKADIIGQPAPIQVSKKPGYKAIRHSHRQRTPAWRGALRGNFEIEGNRSLKWIDRLDLPAFAAHDFPAFNLRR